MVEQALTNPDADTRLMLSDPSGEHDGVAAPHHRGIRPDVFPDAVDEHLTGKMGLLVTRAFFLLKRAHVVAQARNPFEAALLIQQRVHGITRQSAPAHDIGHQRGIDVTAARPHDQPLQGSKTHAGIDGNPLFDRGDTATIAEMARNQFQ